MKRYREKTKEERLRFAQMLDELKAGGMTQKDFAGIMGISQTFVSRLRNGLDALSVSLAKDIEREFPKYRAAWLLGIDERTASKEDALKVMNPMVSALSPERREALLERVLDYVEFNMSRV